MVLEVEGPVEQEDDLEGDQEIDVTPQKLPKKTKIVVPDTKEMMDEFAANSKKAFEQRLLVEQQMLAMEQQILDQFLASQAESAPKNEVGVEPEKNSEALHNFEVTPPIFGLQEGEQLGEHMANILAVKAPRSTLMLHMVTVLPNNLKIPLRVLVDTGCEMCLV